MSTGLHSRITKESSYNPIQPLHAKQTNQGGPHVGTCFNNGLVSNRHLSVKLLLFRAP